MNAIGGLDRNRSVNQGFLVTGRQPDIHFICPSQTVKSRCVDVVPHKEKPGILLFNSEVLSVTDISFIVLTSRD